MTTQAETRQLPEGAFEGFQKAKDLFNDRVHTLTELAKLAWESLKQTSGQLNSVTKATDKAVDTVTATGRLALDSLTTTTHAAVDITKLTSDSVKTITETASQAKSSIEETIEQTKDYAEHTLQTTGQLRSTMSEVIQTAINSSVSDWLQAHPVVFRLVQLLLWATNHPIVSLIIVVFAVAIAWSLIKALVRLIETAGLTLLLAPFKLGQVVTRFCYKSLGFRRDSSKQLTVAKTTVFKNKQQRLAEISTRLEAMQKEHNQLLQEAAAILNEL